mgnify:CR=1 FL=1|jgi:hypothetical protein|tara:strand:+ start:51 stop:806 length:756 start_codon:yes stop_codon:yes gene_type:complete
MKICVQLTDACLENNERVLPYVDAVAFRNIKTVFQTDKEKIFHTSGFVDDVSLELIQNNSFYNFLKLNSIKHISFDLGPSCERYSMEKGYWTPLSKTLDAYDFESIALKRLKTIKKHYDGVIALENLDYHKGGAYESVCEPNFIKRLINKFDVNFAMDIAHARVSASNLNIDFYEYIHRLPLKKITDIHINHPGYFNYEMQDLHDLPTEEDYKILDYIIDISKPSYITIEYNEDINKLIKAILSLRKKLDL